MSQRPACSQSLLPVVFPRFTNKGERYSNFNRQCVQSANWGETTLRGEGDPEGCGHSGSGDQHQQEDGSPPGLKGMERRCVLVEEPLPLCSCGPTIQPLATYRKALEGREQMPWFSAPALLIPSTSHNWCWMLTRGHRGQWNSREASTPIVGMGGKGGGVAREHSTESGQSRLPWRNITDSWMSHVFGHWSSGDFIYLFIFLWGL